MTETRPARPLDHVVRGRQTPNRAFAMSLLAAGFRGGPAALNLAMQLADARPCPRCDFVWNHCRCNATPNCPFSGGRSPSAGTGS
jgi:hypothetical protein